MDTIYLVFSLLLQVTFLVEDLIFSGPQRATGNPVSILLFSAPLDVLNLCAIFT